MIIPSYYTNKSNYIVTIEEWNNRCKWEHLNLKEQSLVCDGGCGINIFGYKIIPDFIFNSGLDRCCAHHDFAWLRGGDERVRLITENEFSQCMQRNISLHSNKEIYNNLAQVYAETTSKIGWLRWNYGAMKSKEEILDLACEKKTNILKLEK